MFLWDVLRVIALEECEMTELEKLGRWALAYLVMAHIALWWTVGWLAWWHIKEWFL
jgi:hypothetical protein